MQELLETLVCSLGQEDYLEEEMQPTLVFLSRESHGQRNLVGYSPWGLKESDMTEATLHACVQDLCPLDTRNIPPKL